MSRWLIPMSHQCHNTTTISHWLFPTLHSQCHIFEYAQCNIFEYAHDSFQRDRQRHIDSFRRDRVNITIFSLWVCSLSHLWMCSLSDLWKCSLSHQCDIDSFQRERQCHTDSFQRDRVNATIFSLWICSLSHLWLCHINVTLTHSNVASMWLLKESCHTVSQMNVTHSHVTESMSHLQCQCTHAWVMSNIWICSRHVTYLEYKMSRLTYLNESMSHLWICSRLSFMASHVKYLNMLTSSHSRMCVTWLDHMCDMTHSRVSHTSIMCVTWLTHVCDMTHSCVSHTGYKPTAVAC